MSFIRTFIFLTRRLFRQLHYKSSKKIQIIKKNNFRRVLLNVILFYVIKKNKLFVL